MKIPEKAVDKFWSKVDIRGEDECWEWKGYFHAWGYGRFYYDHSMHYAHRVSYAIANNDDIDGLFVRHTCDNPPCVNPNHLLKGTAADNTHDMLERGRASCGEKHSTILKRVAARGESHKSALYPESLPRGDNHKNSKITEKQLVTLVEMGKTGNYSQRELGEIFNLSQTHVGAILRGKRRKYTLNNPVGAVG